MIINLGASRRRVCWYKPFENNSSYVRELQPHNSVDQKSDPLHATRNFSDRSHRAFLATPSCNIHSLRLLA